MRIPRNQNRNVGNDVRYDTLTPRALLSCERDSKSVKTYLSPSERALVYAKRLIVQFQISKRTGPVWHTQRRRAWRLEPRLGLPRGPHLECTEAIRMRHVHPPRPPTDGAPLFMLTEIVLKN